MNAGNCRARLLSGRRQGLAIACGLTLALSVLLPACVHAEVHPERGRGDPRIRAARFDADEVYRLHGFVGYQIDLEFERGETFVGLAAGDIEGLSFVAQGNHLFLKPRAASVGTNLTVLTSRREYRFDYTATAARPEPSDPELIFAVRFTYPEEPRPAAAREADLELDERLSAAPAARALNLDYWYCGAPSLRPIAASDDGVHTRMRFASGAELPAIFVANDDGSESLLNFDVESDEIVIHRIARRFVLRRGALAGCIVNRGFRASGERLETGTVAPNVSRKTKGVAP
jgi:type IV secretion system protein VirB9